MHNEPAQKLGSIQSHLALFAVVSVVLPEKSDFFSIEVQYPMIGDGNAMCIAAKIADHLLGATQGRSDINHPFVVVQQADELGKLLRIVQISQRTGQSQFVVLVETP